LRVTTKTVHFARGSAVNCYTVHVNMHVQLENLLPEALRQWAEGLETRSGELAGGRMGNRTEEISIDQEDSAEKLVTINAENGSVVTVNVNVKNYYGHPEWFNRSAFDALVDALKRKG